MVHLCPTLDYETSFIATMDDESKIWIINEKVLNDSHFLTDSFCKQTSPTRVLQTTYVNASKKLV